MSHSIRKYIAVMLVLWLPLFGGNALAAGIAMQHGQGSDMAVAMQDSDCHQHAGHDKPADAGPDTCKGVCHLACSGYLAAKEIQSSVAVQADTPFTPYQFSFYSVSSTPLLPPPLVRL